MKFGDDSATAVRSLAPERVDFDLDCEAYKVFTSHQAAAFLTDPSTSKGSQEPREGVFSKSLCVDRTSICLEHHK